jgi:hypothetical protein
MMETLGPRDPGETGLLDTPPPDHKTNKTKYIPHHAQCGCNQPNTYSNKKQHNLNSVDINRVYNTHTPDDTPTHTLYNTHTTQEALSHTHKKDDEHSPRDSSLDEEEREHITIDKSTVKDPERLSDIILVKELKDIRVFHDRFLHQVDRYRFILYLIDFAQSPNHAEDRESDDNWMVHYGMEEI